MTPTAEDLGYEIAAISEENYFDQVGAEKLIESFELEIRKDEREKCLQAILNVNASRQTVKLFQDAILNMTESGGCDKVEETQDQYTVKKNPNRKSGYDHLTKGMPVTMRVK